METDTTQAAVTSAFWTALLLECDTTTAEAAVLDGIGVCEDISYRTLLTEAVKSMLQRRAKYAPTAVQLLPTELRRLFGLQPPLRECFVLRILLGLSPEVCRALLNISSAEFEDAYYPALKQLPFLSSPNVDS